MMMNDINTKAIELSFIVLEDIIMLRPLTTKANIMALAKSASTKVQDGKDYPEVLKLAYKEMINKLETLSFEEIKEIREIIED
ncbi:MAG: hypothetical protein PHC46_00095 [Clostridia bacterium]|nr:hypothetical protein [Clostridia bacterium]